MTYRIRPMTQDDVSEVEAIYLISDGVQRQEWERSLTEKFLGSASGVGFVAEAAGRIVGGIFCGDTGRRGMVHHLSVTPVSRGQGAGRQLYLAAESFVRLRNRSAVAVGIVREAPRDRFCKIIGFDLAVAPMMLQADFSARDQGEEVSTLEIRPAAEEDLKDVSILFQSSSAARMPLGKHQLFELPALCGNDGVVFLVGLNNGKIVASLLGECSGFRGLLLDWVFPVGESDLGIALVEKFKSILAGRGVLRILAASSERHRRYDEALLKAGFVMLEHERIAMKELVV